MPGFTTHIIMGQECADALDDQYELKALLECRYGAYNLGLQGPDVYFYNPLCVAEGKPLRNIGGIMHELGTQHYFDACLSIIDETEDEEKRGIMIRYLAGFLSHYYTDSICHPYVYSRIGYDAAQPKKKLYGAHAHLENELDFLYYRQYGRSVPEEYHPKQQVELLEEEKTVLARFMADSVNQAYPVDPDLLSDKTASISGSEKHDSKTASAGRSEKHAERAVSEIPMVHLSETLVRQCLAIFRRGIQVRGMRIKNIDPAEEEKVLNLSHESWANSWDKSVVSNKSFPELFQEAKNKTLEAYALLDQAAFSRSDEARKALVSRIGNRSYHSGFEQPLLFRSVS